MTKAVPAKFDADLREEGRIPIFYREPLGITEKCVSLGGLPGVPSYASERAPASDPKVEFIGGVRDSHRAPADDFGIVGDRAGQRNLDLED